MQGVIVMRTLLLLATAAAALSACTTGLNLTLDAADSTSAETSVRSRTDVRGADRAAGIADAAQDVNEMEPALEVIEFRAQETMGPACEPGEGCFLTPCQSNDECQSGWCVQHLGGGVCSQACQEECPQGWSCQQVAGTDPDVVFICVSDFANLCRPCNSGDNCSSIGGATDACIDYGPDGNFCGGPCEADGDCPWGFSCNESATVEGANLKQCVNDTGDCPCTDSSIALGLTTTCEVQSEYGTCLGKRTCSNDGLTACNALIPAPEQCNGLDDDCDAEVDEPTLQGGKYIELCDDGNECTADTCAGAQGCVNEVMESGDCSDADPCTVADHCSAGQCVGTPVECDDDNPCTENQCTATGGCEFVAAPGECDDGNPCTLGDHCIDGECEGVQVGCDCQIDEDCAQLEDGDLCNGVLFCDTAKVPYQCAVVPDSIVECPPPEGVDAPCLTSWCNPEDGQCSFVPTGDDLPCDDGDPCTNDDKCQEGLCTPGQSLNCNDGNPCTDDFCETGAGCKYVLNQAPCSDKLDCTTGDHCANGQCVAGPAMQCSDNNPCTDDACVEGQGCVFTPNAAQCNDGNACTQGDHCSQGLCTPTGPTPCDDSNPCTDDACHPDSGCSYSLNEAPCNDGNVCTLNDHCANGACTANVSLKCNDNNVCTTAKCDAVAGCQFAPLTGLDCTDNNLCTVGDQCEEGVCVPGENNSCSDGNLCTTDTCSPSLGCQHETNTNPCDDGNLCTMVDKCQNGACSGSGLLLCNDNNPYTDDSCDPQQGCLFAPNQDPCDDGNMCTENDLCSNGGCGGSSLVSCDDDNVCTDDSCDPAVGCKNVNNTALCDDEDKCTPEDNCVEGTCVGSGQLNCNDGKVCTDDSCDPQSGCQNPPNNAACEDGNQCTVSDYCQGGECHSGEIDDCDDGNPCTEDSCDPDQGCKHVEGQNCCSPSGQRVPYNSLGAKSQTNCFAGGNPCPQEVGHWSTPKIFGFSAFGQYFTCTGATGCVAHVGIATYGGGSNVCHGKWDVYCDNEYQCSINILGKSCTGSSMTNGCKCDFPGARICSAIKLVSAQDGDNTGACCGGPQPDSAIDAVSAW